MAAFGVTVSELRMKAANLRESNSQFKSQVGNLEAQESSLVGMWEGEARDAFDRAFKEDKARFEEFYVSIEQYCAALEKIADRYDQMERENVAIAQSRNY